MPDPLYLSLWFPSFDLPEMLPHALAVMRQFPFSAQRKGITYLALHPVSWNEPTVLERRFDPPISPEEAVLTAADLLHEDYAYLFEAFWDLWTPSEDGVQWNLQPAKVKFLVHGEEFDDGVSESEGQVEIDLGLDSPFLQEEVKLTAETEARVRANITKLVDFSARLERDSGASARLLWSESEENLAQKLIARMQKVQ